jgi:hypothetical protein
LVQFGRFVVRQAAFPVLVQQVLQTLLSKWRYFESKNLIEGRSSREEVDHLAEGWDVRALCAGGRLRFQGNSQA